MQDEQTSPSTATSASSRAMIVAAIATLAAAFYALYNFSAYADGKGEAVLLSVVVLVGLALVIALMAGLVTVYSFLGVQDHRQPLALPEGSVRALMAFSLLLIFVCLATFLYQGTKSMDLVVAGKVAGVTAVQLAELRKEFVVVEEPIAKQDSASAQQRATPRNPATPQTAAAPQTTPASEPAVFNATYYSRVRSKDADDLGKQIFTTLATVFVSVISFYFGSSATSSGVGAALKVAAADGKLPLGQPPSAPSPSGKRTPDTPTTSPGGLPAMVG